MTINTIANLKIRGGAKIKAVTKPLRSFFRLSFGVSSASPELVVVSVDGSSVEASLSDVAPSSPADNPSDEGCNRLIRVVPEH